MTIKIDKFAHKPSFVESVVVTEENIKEIAVWCHGEIRTGQDPHGPKTYSYIKINVMHPLHKNETKAYIGDHVVYSNKEFKAFTAKEFNSIFTLWIDEKACKDAIEKASVTSLKKKNPTKVKDVSEEIFTTSKPA